MEFKYTDERPTAMLDTECLVNYWMIGFMNVETHECVQIEMYDGHPLDRRKIANILRKFRVISANGIHYDVPMIMLAMEEGTTCADLKRANDDIIVGGLKHWQFFDRHNLSIPSFIDHIDPWEVDPGSPQRQSMKIRGARLHCETIMEMPIHHDAWVEPSDRQIILDYNKNDLKTQIVWYNELKPQIELRARMSDEYGVDLRSKSDAQMAEAIMKVRLEQELRRKVYKPNDRDVQTKFFYDPPAHIKFKTPELQELLQKLRETEFEVAPNGTVVLPSWLAEKKILIGQGMYQMGIGGLHSNEESVSWFADDEFTLIDRDVISYYPSIILINKLFPPHLGPTYLRIYLKMYVERLRAKGLGWLDIAETLKIVLNGLFGKKGSPFAIVYWPKGMIQITMTGQLDILMLIEWVELEGHQVVQANTDGFVTRVRRSQRAMFDAMVFDWECDTGFKTEETEYISLHSRDVNCYAAISVDLKTGKKKAKAKGNIGPCGPGLKGASGLKKNPFADISSQAAIAFLTDGTPIEKTVNECKDIRHFVCVKKSTRVVFQDDEPVGKSLRWYYSKERRGKALMADNSVAHRKNPDAALYTQVGRSEGAKMLLTLPEWDWCPPDLDRDWYIREAYAILQDVGYGAKDPGLAGRSGLFLGMQSKQKTLHYVDAETAVSLCDRSMKSIRNPWKEYGFAPAGMRICKTCREFRGGASAAE